MTHLTCYFGLLETPEQIDTFSLVEDMTPLGLSIMKHMRMVAHRPRVFGDQYVLLHPTQQNEDDEHLDNNFPPQPSHSITAPAYTITLEDMYRLQ